MRQLLDIKLLSQSFQHISEPHLQLENSRLIAQTYAKFENCISVLSDIKARKSYLYYGAVAEQFALKNQFSEIDSIWEEDLLGQVHSEDLQKKYRLEFLFFQLLNTVPLAEREHYELITKLRIRNKEGKYVAVKHRLIYIAASDDGNVWLALCLYQLVYDHPGFDVPQGVIINTRTGQITDYENDTGNRGLSEREKEVMQLIKAGYRSKEIADKLGLSINTVNRHRQNIFQKLNVKNVVEALNMTNERKV